MTPRIRTICIYHGNCADGFTAAWAAYCRLGNEVEFVPGVYGENPPDVTGADVILVDFSYKRDVLLQMADTARSVLVLDHHKTAQNDLAGLCTPRRGWSDHVHEATYWDSEKEGPYIRVEFDMTRSGAQMAWDYFIGGKRPLLVDYVGDRDLWKFDLPMSREISAWVFSHDCDFQTWNNLNARLRTQKDVHRAAEMGGAILKKHDKDIRELLKSTRREMVIGGQRVPVANLPYTMASDAAGAMASDDGVPFAATYFDAPDGRRFSLRSRGDGGADVSEIAARYGGGGHRNAAGFSMPLGWNGDEEKSQ